MSTFSICSTEGRENMYRRGHAFRCSERLPGWLTHKHPGSGPREAVPVGPENLPPSRGNMFAWKQNTSGRGSLLLPGKSLTLSLCSSRGRDLLPSGRRASTIPLPPLAVTRNPAFITERMARPLALAMTCAAKEESVRPDGSGLGMELCLPDPGLPGLSGTGN